MADFMAIDELGRVFLLTDELFLVGNTIEEAIENLISGANPRRFDLGSHEK